MTATLTTTQCEQFERDGYLMVAGAFDAERWIDPILREYEVVLDRLAADLFAAGRISDLHDALPFDQRLIEICAESNELNAQPFTSSNDFVCNTGREVEAEAVREERFSGFSQPTRSPGTRRTMRKSRGSCFGVRADVPSPLLTRGEQVIDEHLRLPHRALH